MYSACIVCKKTLGTNAIFETFPVGERLAFDAARGRLWAVCRHCERQEIPIDASLEKYQASRAADRQTK
jgi:hypothetical protein